MRWVVLLSLTACVGSGDDCSSVVGNQECSSSTDESSFHHYLHPTAVASDTRVLVALDSEEAGSQRIVLTSTDFWYRKKTGLIDLVSGQFSTLAGTPDRAYLIWRDGSTFGALVDATGQLGTPFDFGPSPVTATAIGSQFLVAISGRPARGRWVEADGTLSEPFDLTTSADDWFAIASSDTTAAIAYSRNGVLYAHTLDALGAGPELRIADTKEVSFAVVGKTMYFAYSGVFGEVPGKHILRLDPDGQIVDHVLAEPSGVLDRLVPAGDRLFAIRRHDSEMDTGWSAYQIGLDGSVEARARSSWTRFESADPAIVAVGSNLIVVDAPGDEATVTLFDDEERPPLVIAEGYEVGGCNAGGGPGWLAMVALVGLSRCLRRPSRSRE